MAGAVNSVWAVDMGNTALKALHVRLSGGEVEIVGVDRIEYSKALNSDGMTDDSRGDIIADTLHLFVENNNVTKLQDVAISVPGQSSFCRFITPPPVDPKKIPGLAKNEAIQQIPFDINEVEWDWQLLQEGESPEMKLGIFSIKNDIINGILEPFQRENMKVATVQMSPMALYNYGQYEFKELDDAGKKAVVIVNMGSENTELVVCTKHVVWQRVIPIGGNNFTQAIADTFKLTFSKAEKLKRKAPMSKYAKQIFHAMRPVFTDVGSEIQRSIGYYTSTTKGVKVVKVVAVGGAVKLQGVAKYLQQSLQIPVVKPETFESLVIGEGVSAAKVHENIGDLGVVCGLGLQGLGESRIESNLLPRRIARSMLWARKAQMLIIAAAILLIVSLINFAKVNMDSTSYDRKEKVRGRTEQIVKKAKSASSKLKKEEGREKSIKARIDKQFELFKNRDVLVILKQAVLKCMPNAENNGSQAELYRAFEEGNIENIVEVPRKERQQVFITSMNIRYVEDVKTASFGAGSARKIQKKATGGGGDMGGMAGMMPGGGFGMPGAFAPPSRAKKGKAKKKVEVKDEEQEGGKGFIVEIEGFTPYGEIRDMMEPIGAGKDKSKWGVVTRLRNLDEVVDGNSVFKLFDTGTTQHFDWEFGDVDLESGETPVGVGIQKTISRADTLDGDTRGRSTAKGDVLGEEEVLIDPMTGEEISRTCVLDEDCRRVYDEYDKPVYEFNDQWFRIKAKFVWKEEADSKKEEVSEKNDTKKKRRRSRR